jgi:transposase
MPGARVSEVARRWQICSQQVFGWRRAACRDVTTEPVETVGAMAPSFVPIVAEATPPGPVSRAAPAAPMIEVRLAGAVVRVAQEVLAEDPFSGAVIVYRSKRSDRVKILVWDTSGLVLIWKQLQQGPFRWPPIMDGVMKLSPVEFAALFDGLDWTRVQTTKGILKPTVAA